jgi:hypothetical protein
MAITGLFITRFPYRPIGHDGPKISQLLRFNRYLSRSRASVRGTEGACVRKRDQLRSGVISSVATAKLMHQEGILCDDSVVHLEENNC